MRRLNGVERDLRLVRGQVAPRLGQLAKSWPPYLALACGLALAAALPWLPSANAPISEVVGFGFTFASISVGACFSSIVLALGLPGAERLRTWSRRNGITPDKSALSDLVFVLVWAALSQVALIVVCVLALAVGGPYPLAPSGMTPTHFVGLVLGLMVFFYAVFELVIVVQTLSQVGVVIIAEERANARAGNAPPAPRQEDRPDGSAADTD
ncbi:MAG: hypothetical protein QM804_08850 [Propionicimonas sp.]